jgi:hypothetical protein
MVPISGQSYGWEHIEIQPEVGSSWYYGAWDVTDSGTWAVIDLATYSDYSGSTCERSNCEALQEDYPDTFCEVWGGYGTTGLIVPLATIDDESTGIGDILRALDDYPIYDEDHLTWLEMRLADESWSHYLGGDVRYDLDDCLGDISDHDLQTMYYTITSDQPEPYICEDAVSAYFPYHEDTLRQMRDLLMQGLRAVPVPVPLGPFAHPESELQS